MMERPPPVQCVTCNQFVSPTASGTRKIVEGGDYGTVLSVEFECGRCVAEARFEDVLREAFAEDNPDYSDAA